MAGAAHGELRFGVIAEDAPESIASSDGKGVPTGGAIGALIADVKSPERRVRKQREIDELLAQVARLRR